MDSNPLVERASSARDTPRWSETLRDRSVVLIRPIQPQDRSAQVEFIAGLAQQARRYRFPRLVDSPSEDLVDQLPEGESTESVTFVAVVKEDAHERILGVARYNPDPDGDGCDSAVAVSEEWREKGLGTILMRHLIDVARARGIRTMYALASAENVEMHKLARHLGFRTTRVPHDARLYIHRLELQTVETPPL